MIIRLLRPVGAPSWWEPVALGIERILRALDAPAEFTVATVPSAADWRGRTIFVSDEAGGAITAFSDGTDWRRTSDRAVIS